MRDERQSTRRRRFARGGVRDHIEQNDRCRIPRAHGSAMLKRLYDRLAFAVIGFACGLFAAVVLWVSAHSQRYGGAGGSVFDPGLRDLMKVCGGVFAAIGFVAKDSAGSVLGRTLDASSKSSVDDEIARDVPRWVVAVAVVAVAASAWYFARS
jgi:hypothetical protein